MVNEVSTSSTLEHQICHLTAFVQQLVVRQVKAYKICSIIRHPMICASPIKMKMSMLLVIFMHIGLGVIQILTLITIVKEIT